MHHRIGLLVIVITSTYPVPTPQPKIRMGLFFYVKILENSSVIAVYGWPLARVRNWNGPAVQQSSTTVSEPKKSSRKYAHCCAPNRPCTNRYLKWLFFQTPDIDTNDAREIHSKLVWLRTKAALGYKVHIIYGVTFSNFM